MHNKKKRRKKVHVGEKVEKRNCTRGWYSRVEGESREEAFVLESDELQWK